ncbi:MAG: J domain-containing protein [Acidobacteriota bacterium]
MTTAVIAEEERAWRREVLSFLASRYSRASRRLRDQQWESFRSFAQLWLETYAWREEDGEKAYLGLSEEQRRSRFERFRKQAESWDVTLEFPVDENERRGGERAKWRREFADQRQRMQEREEREASHWEAVGKVLEGQQAHRRVPAHLIECFRVLDLPTSATLAEARQRYRELARKLHPDVSGRREDMVELNEAWEKIVEFLLS